MNTKLKFNEITKSLPGEYRAVVVAAGQAVTIESRSGARLQWRLPEGSQAFADPDLQQLTQGKPVGAVTLRQARELFGGDEIEIPDPHGRMHHLSLKPWADADPDKTRLHILLLFIPGERTTDPQALINSLKR
ncbi:MAG: hypothetical protein KatS3mg053_3805 [Candidatus Roseilinea sp.]|nr:MAG: hypothetical protein KatS3mg053_3805 [Candidatus Roseilinea sp.]